LAGLIRISHHILLDSSEIREEFIQATGPGGQNVNKVATAVRLRFDVPASQSLPEEVKQRLLRLAGRRITEQGELVIEGREYRTQEQNRRAALERLVRLIQAAAEKPKPRHKTHPTLASKQRRLAEKKHKGEIKRLRKYTPDE
jgi:ribosome-associated protein